MQGRAQFACDGIKILPQRLSGRCRWLARQQKMQNGAQRVQICGDPVPLVDSDATDVDVLQLGRNVGPPLGRLFRDSAQHRRDARIEESHVAGIADHHVLRGKPQMAKHGLGPMSHVKKVRNLQTDEPDKRWLDHGASSVNLAAAMVLDQSNEIVPRSDLADHEGRQWIFGDIDHLAKARAVKIPQRARSAQEALPCLRESLFRDAIRAKQFEGINRSSVGRSGRIRPMREIGLGYAARPEEPIHHVLPQTKQRRHDGPL